MKKELTITEYLDGIKQRDLSVLAKAITLVESKNPAHQKLAEDLIRKILQQV